MKRILTAALVLAATSLVSCNSDNKTEETDTTTGEQTATVATDTTLTENKKELMQTLAQHNILLIELGKLASQKGVTDEVKRHGQEMVEMHNSKQTELQELSGTFNVPLNTTLEEKHREEINELQEQNTVDFDKEYWESITDAQKEALDAYDDVLKDITEADATAFGIWARTSEKELRAQYEQALAMQLELKNRI